ncbi:MAG: HAD-IA family hydrolase [Candidatus Goldiibacteriota bacterium]
MIYKKNIEQAKPFITRDSSIIRTVIDALNAPVKKVSLAEASLKTGKATMEHYHSKTEEIYYFTAGTGEMSINGKKTAVKKGDGVLIPAFSRHRVENRGKNTLRFLCCCGPPYSHRDTVITGYNIKMAVFDFDGTLVDSIMDIHFTANQMAREYGMKPVSVEKVKKAVGAGLHIFLKKIFGKTGRDPGKLKEHYAEIYNKHYKDHVRPYKNVKKTLEELKKKKIKTAIVSNKSRVFIKKILKHLELDKYFAEIIGKGDLKKDKPHPFPYFYLMKKYGIDKDEMIMAGDSIYDIESAKQAGIYSMFLTYGYGNYREVMKRRPDIKSADIFDIAGLV